MTKMIVNFNAVIHEYQRTVLLADWTCMLPISNLSFKDYMSIEFDSDDPDKVIGMLEGHTFVSKVQVL